MSSVGIPVRAALFLLVKVRAVLASKPKRVLDALIAKHRTRALLHPELIPG
jgi:hypothetical protein